MTIRFPNVPKLFKGLADRFSPGEDIERYFHDYNAVIQKELDKRTSDDTTRAHLYLSSPDESVWEIKVSDLGAISATKVLG